MIFLYVGFVNTWDVFFLLPVDLYAHMEIVVVLIVVKFGGFLVIARNPPDGF